MQFILNGNKKEYTGDPELPLLTYLREHEGITSPKDGCAPQAACGCCVVELNGKGVLSCAVPMKKVEGGEVTTIEGIGEYRQRVFASAFIEKSGVQCGFCIPGIVMQAKVLVDINPSPTREEVEFAINPNLCRCTGYKKIVDSILYAADAIRDLKEIPILKTDGKVGKRHPKYNAANLVLGKSLFVADMKLDGMVYGALKFSDHPRATVLSINTKKAQALSGVLKVFTAIDIPGDRYSGLIISDWPLMIDVGEQTRYVGDVIAGVVAETEAIARCSVKLIEVEYEVLKPLTDMEQALTPGAHKIHPKGNLLSETIINRGEVEAAINGAEYVSKGVYYTQRIEHGFMETECSIARTTENGVEVLSQGQGIYEDQKQIAKILNLPLDKVRVILVPNGGGFGGKEDLSVQGHAALFSFLLKKPVKVFLNRDESIIMHPKRHPLRMNYTLGCNKQGKLTVLKADILGDTGAYASVGMKILERAAGHATGAYQIPNVNIVSRAVYTNNLPCGAMRGFGVNQVTFAVESCIDDLCEKGNFDRWQFRYDNALVEGDMTATGQIIRAGSGVRQTLLAVKDFFYNAKFAGIACGIKNTGIGNGMADEGKIKIEIISNEKIILHHGWTEMGQGVNTMAVQFLCEETGIDPDIVEVRVDTSEGATAGMTTASRATSIIGNSISNTCKKLKEDLNKHSLAELAGNVYLGEWVCDWTTKPGNETKEIITHYSYSYATQVVVLNGEGEIDTVYAAHDAGKIINPNLFEGQIEGSIHMGLGYALSEDLPLEEGVPKSTRLRKCGILRAKEMPKLEVIGIEVPDPHGPYGVKGVGEIGLVPTAAAVANAFYQYDGTRYYRLPIKERIKAK
ncbi:MAG: selenium-dependent xanthine dehydrogenase [Ignavibacteria bacterium CG2_30_36_16]|nr:selenium-dependent xanthine dehydrogenase [Ignavibacteria bacterium]OIP61336.1 MAG: selenium-dependent xanthine dehydrogenase [Ignavibacteria bacterium CG2_30_36_16]